MSLKMRLKRSWPPSTGPMLERGGKRPVASRVRKKGDKGGGLKQPERAIRPKVDTLDISPDEKGLPRWASISENWKKYCWVLEAAHGKGVDGLTTTEISHLIEKVFREDHPGDSVANLRFHLKKSVVKSIKIEVGSRKYQGWKILNAGTKELMAGKDTKHQKKAK